MERSDLQKYLCDYICYDNRIDTNGVDVESLVMDCLDAFESTTGTEIVIQLEIEQSYNGENNMDLLQWAYQSGIIDNNGFLTFRGLELFREFCPDGTLSDLQRVLAKN